MEVVECEGKLYYREEDLKMSDPAYFYGCSRPRSIIEKKSLSEGDYVYAILNKKTGLWEIKSREYRPAKVLVSKEWVEHNVPSLKTTAEEDRSKQEQGIRLAPPLLDLEDQEKFRDQDGNILEIEVRGERHHKKCFFLVKDISDAFMIHSLSKTLLDERATYKEGIDFINFICPKVDNSNPGSNKKMLFLTYEGLLKTLYISRSSQAQYFREWATEKLFTIQMGEQEEKDTLAGSLIGVSAKTIQEVFRRNTEKTPCIYLFKICHARDLFPEKNHKKDEIICKFGLTDDLPRRTREHNNFFSKQKNICGSVQLVCFSIIDPKFLSEAETNIASYFRRSIISYENQTEMVCVNADELKDIKKHCGLVQRSFLGCYKEMLDKIHKLETELAIREERHEKELLQKEVQFQSEKHRADLLEKDLENEKLKRQLLEFKLKHAI